MRSDIPAIIILIVSVIVATVGVYYGYNILINKPNLTNVSNISISLNNTSNLTYTENSNKIKYNLYIPITLYNTQSIPTPSPFQQDIAICNDNISIGPNFAYINSPTLFYEIVPNGQNVIFTDNNGNILYSWYEGQLYYNGVTCDVWWINLPNGIPANSNVTIYMYIGNTSSNYYQQYYPYVGTNAQVIGTMQYDNGQKVFIAYGYFNNTFDGWSGYMSPITSTYYVPQATPNGIEMLNARYSEGTYILPPNNWNIPEIPLIVEEAWYYTWGADENVIALFGNTSQQIEPYSIGSTYGAQAVASNLSTFVQFEYYYFNLPPDAEAAMLKSAVTDQYLNYTYFPPYGGTVYSYLIVNSTYAQTGYYIYNSNQVWAPLTLLDTYTYNVYNSTNINNQISGYVYSNLNYNPFQYGTLEIGAGASAPSSYQYIEWVVARAYPPNGVMPSIYINSSYLPSNLINQQNSGGYPITLYNTQFIPTPSPFQQDIAICNGTINIGPNFAYINNPTLFNQINSDGSNVYFATTCNNNPNIYSWYEGQLYYNGVTCDVWWINLPNGIPANSNVTIGNITICMNVGPNNSNYYQQYYPYVGVSPNVDPSRKYDNGQKVFIAYGYFNNTFDGWTGYNYTGPYIPTATPNGIEMLNNKYWEGTYILPPNNWNIPEISLIVEEAWYYTSGADANTISLFGNTSQQIQVGNIGSTPGNPTPASTSSTFAQFQYWWYQSPSTQGVLMLKSAVTDQYLNYTYFPPYGGTVYSYLIVTLSYAQAGYYMYDGYLLYNPKQIWAPLTLLDTYPLSYNPNYGNYTYYDLNQYPYQYPTLEIGAGVGYGSSYQYIEWVVARAYPPNGVMPLIYIG